MDSEYRIEMNNFKMSFGGIHALKNVAFKVKPGEIYALVGQMFGVSAVGVAIKQTIFGQIVYSHTTN